MKPYIFRLGVNLLLQYVECCSLSAPHLSHLFVEQACYCHSQQIEIYRKIVKHLSFFVATCNIVVLAQCLDGPLHAVERLLFSEEGRDVEHPRTLALSHESESPCVHDIPELVFLLLNPLMNDA